MEEEVEAEEAAAEEANEGLAEEAAEVQLEETNMFDVHDLMKMGLSKQALL